MYQYTNDGETFGQYDEEALAADARAAAFQSLGRFAGSLARAFMTRRQAVRAARMPGLVSNESPCPDAAPGTPPSETPCAKRARELQAQAEAWRASRSAQRGR